MTAFRDAIRRPWRLPAGVVLSALLFVSLLLILYPRDQLLTFAARTEVMAFTAGDDVTTRFWIASGIHSTGPTPDPCGAVQDQLVTIARDATVTIHSVADFVVFTIAHPGNAGTIDGKPLGPRAWIRACGPQDENLIVPFVGAFKIGEQVGPTTAAVLLDGRAEVIERVLFGSLTYVNRTVDLARGDRLDVEQPGRTARGFVHFTWDRDGMFVRAQADPGTAHLFRTPERAPLTLRGSLWGRLRDGAEAGVLLLVLSGITALMQIASFFSGAKHRDVHQPTPAPPPPPPPPPPRPLETTPVEPTSTQPAPSAAPAVENAVEPETTA